MTAFFLSCRCEPLCFCVYQEVETRAGVPTFEEFLRLRSVIGHSPSFSGSRSGAGNVCIFRPEPRASDLKPIKLKMMRMHGIAKFPLSFYYLTKPQPRERLGIINGEDPVELDVPVHVSSGELTLYRNIFWTNMTSLLNFHSLYRNISTRIIGSWWQPRVPATRICGLIFEVVFFASEQFFFFNLHVNTQKF